MINRRYWDQHKIYYALLLAGCFLLFQQGDLYHTSASSYAYLNGHFADFYDYNRVRVGRNDYLPLMYVVFAIWNLPLKILGLMSTIDPYLPIPVAYMVLTTVEIVWIKLLLVTGFAISSYIVSSIASLVEQGLEDVIQPALPRRLFATSPIAVFSILIFGGYDIIGLCFSLTGLYLFLRNRLLTASAFFSLAISFKFFALVAFVPLVLLFEKRIHYLFLLWAIGSAASLTQVALYWQSPSFRETIFLLALGKAAPITTAASVFLTPMFYFAILYLALCVGVYLYQPKTWIDKARAAVFIPIAGYGLMFSAVVWHPQWLLLSAPFFALAALFLKEKKLLLIADSLGAIALVWITVNFWKQNVDSSILTLGPMKALFPYVYTSSSSFLTGNFVPFFKFLFYLYLFFPLILLLRERFPTRIVYDNNIADTWVSIRMLVGVGIFVVPALVSAWIPKSLALKLDPEAAIADMRIGPLLAKSTRSLGEIYLKQIVKQDFISPFDGLSVISVRLATYARENSSSLRLRLLDVNGRSLAEQMLHAHEVKDSVFHHFLIPPEIESAGKTYTFVIDSLDAASGNAFTVWIGDQDLDPSAARLEFAGIPLVGALALRLYFTRESRERLEKRGSNELLKLSGPR